MRLYNSAPERGVNISELATTALQFRSVLNVVVKLAVVGFYTQSMCHTVYHTIPYKDKPVTVATQIQIQYKVLQIQTDNTKLVTVTNTNTIQSITKCQEIYNTKLVTAAISEWRRQVNIGVVS